MIKLEEYLRIPSHIKINSRLIRDIALRPPKRRGGSLENIIVSIGRHCPICFLSIILLKIVVFPFNWRKRNETCTIQ
jgi:hypothetical protein